LKSESESRDDDNEEGERGYFQPQIETI
jgi:hypothetical protein